jgi:hypothetical protein
MGSFFNVKGGFFGPPTGSVVSYAYVAPLMVMTLKKFTFQRGLF